MFYINIELSVPYHSGVSANLIYEISNDLGILHSPDNSVQLRSIAGITLPYILLDNCYVNGNEIKRAYVEALGEIACVNSNFSNYLTYIGKEQFEIIGASEALPGMNRIDSTDVFANPSQVYKAYLGDSGCLAIVRRSLLSNGFRFKAFGEWYGIVNDITIKDAQPEILYPQDKVHGFVISSDNSIFPINEVGTIY